MAADDPATYREPGYVLVEDRSVSLFLSGDPGHNTIVLGGIDVVVPLELDLDDDPLTDDTVSLRSVHGLYERTLSMGDEDVRTDPERRLVFYRFRHVPIGLYRLAVRVGAAWVQLDDRLAVGRDGATLNGRALTDALPDVAPTPGEEPIELEDHEDEHEHEGCACGGGIAEEPS